MLTKPFKLTLIIVIAVILIVAGFAYWSNKSNKSYVSNLNSSQTPQVDQTQLKSARDVMQSGNANQTTIFASPNGFSFYYPKTFKVGQFEEGEGDIVLLQENKSNASNKSYPSYQALGLQIFTKDFNDANPITAQRIQKELPDIKMLKSQTAVLDGAQAVTFTDASGLYNVWVIYNKKLFQISGYAQEKDFINQILNTWKWQDL